MTKVIPFTRVRERKRLLEWKQPRDRARWRWPKKQSLAVGVVSFLVAVVVAMVLAEFGFRAAGCNVKGNISASGERIYHVLGQEYYSATHINWLRGEQWFCSEAAARAAGWRKARV